jgi:hypothetical protein
VSKSTRVQVAIGLVFGGLAMALCGLLVLTYGAATGRPLPIVLGLLCIALEESALRIVRHLVYWQKVPGTLLESIWRDVRHGAD